MDIKPINILKDNINNIKVFNYRLYNFYYQDIINCYKERIIYMSPEYR